MTQARDACEPVRLAEQQAALRRIAALVAGRASSADVFAAVAEEVAGVMHAPLVSVGRYDDDGRTVTIMATRSETPTVFQPGTRWPLDGPSVSAEVLRTGQPTRIENYVGLGGTIAGAVLDAGAEGGAGAPVVVDGRIWGAIALRLPGATLPDRLEDRLAEFTDRLATAIANSEAREQLAALAEEQAALRRVATLVARGAPPAEVFQAVIAEVGLLVPTDAAALSRYESDGTVTMIGGWSRNEGSVAGATRHEPGAGTLAQLVFDTRRPARVESYTDASGSLARAVRGLGWRSSVGAPVIVDGRLWGVVGVASTTDAALPPDMELRLAEFTELLGTAIANTQAREELTRLADEQAALRRVATLVARGVPPAGVFEAVIAEVGLLAGADAATLTRFEADRTSTAISVWRDDGQKASAARSSVAAPVVVDGRVWGMATVLSSEPEPLPTDTERRLAEFTELVATAIANADSRAELETSRTRIVATADATRRRLERDLHDGALQQLVALTLELRAATARVPRALGDLRVRLARIAERMTSVLDELGEIALGIHPATLAEGGLQPALTNLARRSPIPVTLDVRMPARLLERLEVASYYVVSEALANAAKHARASAVHVAVEARDRVLQVSVRDNGIGGADPARGSGLLGLKDRAEAIGGTIRLESRKGAGTALYVQLPFDGADA